MSRSRIRLRGLLPRFLKGKKGISAVEFALLAPVMLCFYFGCIEVSSMLIIDRKVTNATANIADLVSRRAAMDATEMTNVFNSAALSLAPEDYTTARIRVTSVVWNGAGTDTVVSWSRSTANWTPRATGSTVVAPAGMIATGGSAILAEMEYDYTSITGLFEPETGLLINTSRTLTDDFWMRPRRVDQIPFS